MIRLFTFLFIGFLCSNLVNGQVGGDCVQKKDVVKIVTINANKTFIAQININMCYKEDRNINLIIFRRFKTNGVDLNDSKARRQGHRLFLKDIKQNSTDVYTRIPYPDPLREIVEPISVVYSVKDSVNWKEKTISFTLKFSYKKGKDVKEEDISFDFRIPDNPDKTELINEDILKGEADTVGAVDSVNYNKTAEQEPPKNIKKETLTPEQNRIAIEMAGYLDSIRFYINRVNEIYNNIETEMSNTKKEKLKNQFHIAANRFNYFTDSCNYPNTKEYKDEFDRLSRYISKGLNGNSTSVNEEVTEKNTKKDSSKTQSEKKPFHVKDLYLYILGIMFLILLALYIYPKIKKKKK